MSSRDLKRSPSEGQLESGSKRRATQPLSEAQGHRLPDASPPKSPVYPSIFSVGRPARVSTKFARLESFASFDDTDDHEFSDDDFDWNECVNEIDAREFRDQAAAAGSGFSLGLGQASKLVSSPPTALLPPAGDRLTFDEGLASAEHSSFTPSRTNGSRPTPHLDGHRELPGMIGSLVRGSRKCTCSCTCGAVDYNRSVGFEPVPPRTTRMDKQPNGPTMNEFGREVPPPLAQSKGAKAAEALAAARSFQTTTCTSPSTFGSALSSSNSLINQRAGLGESDAHTNVPNLARSIEAGKSLAASTSSIQQWAGGPAVGQLSMTDRANVTATKPPPLDGAMEPELSAQQKAVLDMVMKKQSLMFTGGAGTGKSVLARALVRKLRQTYNWDDAVAVCALTGIAALHIGGQTIHAWAGVGLGNKPVQELIKVVKKSKASTKRWLAAQVLLVDEVSMMDAVLFDKLEELARSVRQSSKPFGGIQLVLIGDFYQLPPVITAPTFFGRHDYQAQLKLDYQELCKTYVSRYLFHAKTWTKCIPRTVILRQVFRQADQTFVRMLEETRRGELKPATITQFYRLSRPLSVADGIQPTELYSTRSQVADANLSRLKALPGDVHTYKSLDQSFVHGQQREFTSRYKGGDDGDTQARIKEYLDKRAMAPAVVELKEGAQVMLIKNLINGLVNGSRGIVTGFMDTSSLQVASEQSGRCFFSDPNAQLTTKLVKRKVSKLRRVPKSGAVRAKCVVNAVASEGRPSAGPSVDVKTSPPSDGATEAVSGQGSGNAAPSVGAENLQAAPINVGPSSAENSDVTMPVAGNKSGPKAIPACTTAGAAFEDSEWSYEEYETEEEVVEEEPPPRIELAVASGSKAQDDLGAGRSKLSAFMRVHSHPPASRGAGPGLEYAHAGVKYPLVRFVDGSTMLMVPLKFNVESPVGADEASRVQVPLILAWSMSIHKAQGQTLDKCKVNLSRVFEKSQAYVALSRARSLEGLQVEGFDASKVRTDPLVLEWEREVLAKPDWLAGADLQEAKAKAKTGVVNGTVTVADARADVACTGSSHGQGEHQVTAKIERGANSDERAAAQIMPCAQVNFQVEAAAVAKDQVEAEAKANRQAQSRARAAAKQMQFERIIVVDDDDFE